MTPGLPPGLAPEDLPPHQRGAWVQDFHSRAPDGQNLVTLYGYDEVSMGYFRGFAMWSAAKTPWAAKGGLGRIPLARFVHWIGPRRFALKVHAHHGEWIRPLLVIDLDAGFAVLPFSSGETPDLGMLAQPITTPFAPLEPGAVAKVLDLIHLA